MMVTPLVKELAARWPQGEMYSWFDIGDVSGEHGTIAVDATKLARPPFERTMLCGREITGEKFAISMVDRGDRISILGIIQSSSTPSGYTVLCGFSYRETDQGLELIKSHKNDEEPDTQDSRNVLGIIDSAFSKINAGTTAYQATVKTNSPTNQRRVKQGRPPLIYDWHTVELPAKNVRGECLGGTHASPRRHERRGHWRMTPTGKRVFVRQCLVGDASRGSVFKDYKVT